MDAQEVEALHDLLAQTLDLLGDMRAAVETDDHAELPLPEALVDTLRDGEAMRLALGELDAAARSQAVEAYRRHRRDAEPMVRRSNGEREPQEVLSLSGWDPMHHGADADALLDAARRLWVRHGWSWPPR